MICPNCGRELPDTVRVCPGCSAVQRVFKRRHADADIPEPSEPVRVSRRIAPDHSQTSSVGNQESKQNASTPDQRAKQGNIPRSGSAGQVPIGLSKQASREQAQVRHVRRAPDHIRRKIDARPAMMDPPIYRKSHKRLLTVVFIILLIITPKK